MIRLDFEDTCLHSVLRYFIVGLRNLNMYSFCLVIFPVVLVGIIACAIAIICDFIFSSYVCIFR